jgi:hypothetical protein
LDTTDAFLRGTWPKASDEGKKYFVLYLRWLRERNFLVQILCGDSVIGHD